jgi:cell division septation protein DedD
MAAVRALGFWLLSIHLLAAGCSRHPHPVPPPDLPTAMPSEVEAGRVRPGAGEAMPHPAAAPAPASALAAGGAIGVTRVVYRVQLMATADGALAERRAQEFRRVFSEPVRVDAEGGFFKIRVGACAERGAAETLQRKAVAAGIRDAFVMEANEPAR